MVAILLIVLGLFYSPVYAANNEIVNVVTEGLVPNSAANQSAAFQVLLNTHGNDTSYFFPAGVYILSDLVLTGAKRLTFYGEGPASIWQYRNPPTSYARIWTCTDCEDITLHDFMVDNKHILSYGGLVFYHVQRLTVVRMVFTDSLPRTSYPTDVYGIVVGAAAQMNDTITVTDSLFFQLTLEIDNAAHVQVQRNVFWNSKSAAAIGAFSIANGTKALDWWVEHNTIVHPAKCGICFNLDPAANDNTTWQEFRIFYNIIHRITNGWHNIRFGTSNTSIRVVGTIFDDIIAVGNKVVYIGVAQDQPLVKLSGTAENGMMFTNVHLGWTEVTNLGE